MIQIEKIEIYYFRSIYNLKLSGLKDLCVLSGKNDCGKSNILKALNLFFNNETDWQTVFDFQKDFSIKRLDEVRKTSIKGKQFVRVKLHFKRGNKSVKSLPEKFFVLKTWYRNSIIPEVKSSIENQFHKGKIKAKNLDRALAGLQNYLNRIRFEYIPSVKDRNFFIYSLGLLQDTILENRSSASIEEAVKNLNISVEEGAKKLNEEFSNVCGVETDIRLPKELALLFRAFSVTTKMGFNEMPLIRRGDGIQARFLPSLLYHISKNSKLTYIWGFEEPENCLEHALSSELALELQRTYSSSAQILLTSHSPAFLALEGDNLAKYRIYSKEDFTNSVQIYPKIKETKHADILNNELGLLDLVSEQQKIYIKKQEELQLQIKNLDELRKKYKETFKPILLTEGKSDFLILQTAWNKLYPSQDLDFRILSCNTLPDKNGEAAGAGMLQKALDSCRPDQPITIGLFDYDEEGFKAFANLNKHFVKLDEMQNVKLHKNKKCAAFCIPFIENLKDFYEVENLPIEYLFPEEYLFIKNASGYGL